MRSSYAVMNSVYFRLVKNGLTILTSWASKSDWAITFITVSNREARTPIHTGRIGTVVGVYKNKQAIRWYMLQLDMVCSVIIYGWNLETA